MSNRIILNTVSHHGNGAIKEIPRIAKTKGFKHVFVCSDPDLVKFGVTAKVTNLLDENKIPYTVYSGIKPNPTIENVKDGVEAFKASGADFMITIGGGSSMDTAKAIGIIITNPEFADVRSLEGVAPTKNHAVPTIAVPTTAGTAAEVTINYVITDLERERKFVCVDEHDIPEYAVVDPDDRYAEFGRQRPYCRNGHGCAHARHRRIYHQGGMGTYGHVPSRGDKTYIAEFEGRRSEHSREP